MAKRRVIFWNFRKKFIKKWTYDSRQKTDCPGFFANIHKSQKKRHNPDQANGYLHAGSRRIKYPIHDCLKDICIPKKNQFDECYNKSNQEKRNPDEIQGH